MNETRALKCSDAFIKGLYVLTEAQAHRSFTIPVVMNDSPVGSHYLMLVGDSICLPLAITAYDIRPGVCTMDVRALSAVKRRTCLVAFTHHTPLPELYDPLRGSRDLGKLFQLALET